MMRTSLTKLHPQPLLIYIHDHTFLGNDSNVRENMLLPKLDTFVLLTNEGPSMDKKDEHWSKEQERSF